MFESGAIGQIRLIGDHRAAKRGQLNVHRERDQAEREQRQQAFRGHCEFPVRLARPERTAAQGACPASTSKTPAGGMWVRNVLARRRRRRARCGRAGKAAAIRPDRNDPCHESTLGGSV